MTRLPDGVAAGMLVRAAAARPELAEAALANDAIQCLLAAFPKVYSRDAIRRCPQVRVEFVHATVIGHAGEGLAIGLRKNWGAFQGFHPLRADDPVDPFRVLFIFKEGCPYNRRVLQRQAMKRRLPKDLRRWVNAAYRSTRRDFIAGLPEDAAFVIRRALRLDPVGFWRAARGRLDLQLPPPPVQLTLFADMEGAARWPPRVSGALCLVN
jgi:hypothetical protein